MQRAEVKCQDYRGSQNNCRNIEMEKMLKVMATKLVVETKER